jgi:transcriptional regulator with XRE-family HTH domain
MTLTGVAKATGISKSTMSRLETGQRRPTLELLLALSHAYRVSLDDLVAAPEEGDPRIQLKPSRVKGRTVIPLTRQPNGVQAWKIVIPTSNVTPEPRAHDGYEWIYVLSGRMRLVLGGQDWVLGPGEPHSIPRCRTGSAAPATNPRRSSVLRTTRRTNDRPNDTSVRLDRSCGVVAWNARRLPLDHRRLCGLPVITRGPACRWLVRPCRVSVQAGRRAGWIQDRQLVAVAGSPIEFGECAGQDGQPLVEQRLDLCRSQPLTDRSAAPDQ